MALRGDLFRCIDLLASLRKQFLVPMHPAVLHGPPHSHPTQMAALLPAGIPRLTETVPALDARDCGRALHAIVAIYDFLRERVGITRHSLAAPAVRAYLARHFPRPRQGAHTR